MPSSSVVPKMDIEKSHRRRGIRFSRAALFLLGFVILAHIVVIITMAVLYVERGSEIIDLQRKLSTTPVPLPPVTPPSGKCATVLSRIESIQSSWKDDAPGICRRLYVEDLPPASLEEGVLNFGGLIPRPPTAFPKVPVGFEIHSFTTELVRPRLMRVAPNGDVFVTETDNNRTMIIKSAPGSTVPTEVYHFTYNYTSDIVKPFGLAFYPPGNNPQWIYIANEGNVIRFPYVVGDVKARGPPEVVVPELPTGGHWTRDVAFSRDGAKMFVSVGSMSNVGFDHDDGSLLANETNRAMILEYNPDGSSYRMLATGIRNPVGLAVNPTTGDLWTSVNERDGLGDYLVPDYITRVREDGFYGWPWYYMGPNLDPRHNDTRPELRNRALVPDVLLQAHSASLQMEFYTSSASSAFPSEYLGDAFAAEHGSWNRRELTGYKVIRIPVINGVPTGEYQDFVTGFITEEGQVWGRPAGVAVAQDGALLVSDDHSNTIWRVSYKGTH